MKKKLIYSGLITASVLSGVVVTAYLTPDHGSSAVKYLTNTSASESDPESPVSGDGTVDPTPTPTSQPTTQPIAPQNPAATSAPTSAPQATPVPVRALRYTTKADKDCSTGVVTYSYTISYSDGSKKVVSDRPADVTDAGSTDFTVCG